MNTNNSDSGVLKTVIVLTAIVTLITGVLNCTKEGLAVKRDLFGQVVPGPIPPKPEPDPTPEPDTTLEPEPDPKPKPATTSGCTITTKFGAELYVEADAFPGQSISRISRGTKLKVLEKQRSDMGYYYKVQYNNDIGWVYGQFVNADRSCFQQAD